MSANLNTPEYPMPSPIDGGNWLPAHLRARRCELELTQEELAARTHTVPIAISRLEHGSYLPSLPVLQRILTALGEELVIRAAAPASPSGL
jgi:predicted transcriptional regulator